MVGDDRVGVIVNNDKYMATVSKSSVATATAATVIMAAAVAVIVAVVALKSVKCYPGGQKIDLIQ